MIEIKLENESDRWKWRCPRGHTSWEPTNHHWWCAECARAWNVDPVFYELVNQATGKRVERDDVRLITRAGPYDDIDEPRRGGARSD